MCKVCEMTNECESENLNEPSSLINFVCGGTHRAIRIFVQPKVVLSSGLRYYEEVSTCSVPANNSDKCTTIMAALERELGGKPAAESSSKLLLRTTADPEWVCCTVELFSSVDKSPKQVEVQEDNNTSRLFD